MNLGNQNATKPPTSLLRQCAESTTDLTEKKIQKNANHDLWQHIRFPEFVYNLYNLYICLTYVFSLTLDDVFFVHDLLYKQQMLNSGTPWSFMAPCGENFPLIHGSTASRFQPTTPETNNLPGVLGWRIPKFDIVFEKCHGILDLV